jgi:DNA-binding IclR family transcriptional regulator
MDRLFSIDLLVAMKLAAHDGEPTSVRQLEEELGLSKSAAANSLQRLRELDLVKDEPAHFALREHAAPDVDARTTAHPGARPHRTRPRRTA